MGVSLRIPAELRPVVNGTAGYIRDPVTRLRFVKALAPALQRPQRNGRGPKRLVLMMLAILAPVLAFAVIVSPVSPSRLRAPAPVRNSQAVVQPVPQAPDLKIRTAMDVWLVEKTGEAETYSNGLRIDNRFLVATHRRSYLAFPMDGSPPIAGAQPVGIVFHSTESRQAPFEAKENGTLKRLGESLLEYVSRKQAYNFVIDRFGRVYRVVAEDQAANHCGFSVWADEKCFYVNLNESFLGLSFEAASSGVQPEEDQLSPAQVASAAMLIEMLRCRFQISTSNCVTHAQVSVNPGNMRVGWHTDWASGFPFEKLGLPDNYGAALPSIWAFGFDHDPGYAAGSPGLQAGVENSTAMFERKTAAAGLRAPEYKKALRQRYREILGEVRRGRPADATE